MFMVLGRIGQYVEVKEDANHRFKKLVNPRITDFKYGTSRNFKDKIITVIVEDDAGNYFSVGIEVFKKHFNVEGSDSWI